MRYLASSFSIQMVPDGGHLRVSPITDFKWSTIGDYERGVYCPDFYSVVGHEATANLLAKLTGFSVKVNRETIRLNVGDELIIAQPINNRVALGAEIEEPILSFYRVEVLQEHKCKTLAQYWDEELTQELERRSNIQYE